MFTTLATVAATLAATAAALPGAGDAVYATWPVTNFGEGCSPGGCVASFNVSAPAGYVAGAPAFDVVCHPVYIQRGWIDCDPVGTAPANAYVQSMWTEASSRELIKISVAHIWTTGARRDNATGFAEIEAGTAAFDVPVTQLSAVL